MLLIFSKLVKNLFISILFLASSHAEAYGDLNQDGSVNIQDVMLSYEILSGSIPITETHMANGDIAPVVNNLPKPNGVFNIADLLIIQRLAVGLIDLPIYNLTDYPSLKHFWRMNETVLPLVDDVAGIQWIPPVSEYDSQIKAWLIGDSSDYADATGIPRPYPTPVTGNLASIPATSDILIIGVGRTIPGTSINDNSGKDTGHPVDFLRVVMGDFKNPDFTNFTVHMVGASNRVNTHPGLFSSAGFVSNDYIDQSGNYTPSIDEDLAIYASYVRNGGNVTCGIVKSNGDRPNIYVTPFSINLTLPIEYSGLADEHGEVNPGSFMHADGAKFYGIALFSFENGLPNDVDIAIDWMIDNWKNVEPGKRTPYPGWVGLK